MQKGPSAAPVVRSNVLAQLQWARPHDEAVDEAARENASRGAITASPFNPVGLTSTTASQVVCHARSDGQPRGRSERSAYDRYDVENCCNQSEVRRAQRTTLKG